jgi:hypothetical protein
MTTSEPKILCKTPTPGKQGTRIPRWKYDAIRRAIRKAVPASKQGIPFKELPSRVGQLLSTEDRTRIGSITWHTVTVKLHLETCGEIERVVGARPQRIRRTTG